MMLELTQVSKRYPGQRTPALDRVSLRVEEGEFVAVLGRSGAGKSTLIRCVNRLIEPDAGRIHWKGRELTALSSTELRHARSDIGMIFQHFHLLPRLSVRTNAVSGRIASMPRWRSLLGWYDRRDLQDADAALREVGLQHLARRRVEELSGGQQQRVAIARVLMQQPSLLLGDEPISNLDEVTAGRIMELLSRLHRQYGLTVLLNLHDIGMARAYATRLIGLASGRIVFDGPPERLGEPQLQAIYASDDEELEQ